ncbi:MAG: hypothetical protein M3500_01500 [Actinomycetota bacterium]|nr:hypothetical protein [Actinomycetota bacterium]
MNITGVVLIDLDDPAWADREFLPYSPIPARVQVRVLIGDARDVPLADCRAVSSLVWSAASVEVVGSDPRGIRALVDHLRSDERLAVA